MNPIHTWKSSISLLTLLYAYSCTINLLRIYVFANSGRPYLRSLLGVLTGLCCAVAFVEVVISHARHRNVNGAFVGVALTACAILSVTEAVMIIPYLFRSLSTTFIGFISLVISIGPPCFLAFATWIGRKTIENYRVGIDNVIP